MKTKINQGKEYTRRKFIEVAGSTLAAGGLFSTSSRGAGISSGTPDRPNILLVFPDQLRADWNSLDQSVSVRTPHLARLAREGTRFTRAYCPAPLCAPSRACLAQGKMYGRTGVFSNLDDNPIGVETFYQKLRHAGYRVGSLGKADLRKAAFDWGPDGLHNVGGRSYFREWGFTDGFDSEGKMAVVNGVLKQRKKGQPLNPYARMLEERRDGSLELYLSWYAAWQGQDFENHDYGYTVPYDLADAAYNDNWVGANALALLEREFPVQIPWFLQVNFPGPHDPADITNNMAGWYRSTFYAQPIRNNQLPPDVHQAIRRNYAAMVDNVDRWLGRFLEVLERRGELEKTLIVFSSDHGEMLGDHNCWGKSLPYQSSASVPLVVRGPGVKSGRVSESVTTTLDLAATFLDFAGLPIPRSMDSKSLRPVLSGLERGARSHITAALGGWRMVCDGRFKLVQGIDLSRAHGYGGGVPDEPGRGTESTLPDEQLFDLETDPSELDNLVHRRADIASRLYSLLPMIPR